MAQAKLFGSSIKRREDPRLITGKGVFTDDVKLPGQVHAVFVRSPHAHARLRRVDVSRAKQVPGVVAAFTGKELADGGVGPLPTIERLGTAVFWMTASSKASPARYDDRPGLFGCRNIVWSVGRRRSVSTSRTTRSLWAKEMPRFATVVDLPSPGPALVMSRRRNGASGFA